MTTTAGSVGRSGTSRVLILTASVGGGHDGPARELARRLATLGVDVEVADLVAVAPYGTGRLFRQLFRAQLSWAPGTWGRWFEQLDHQGRPLPAPVRLVIGASVGRINALLTGDDSRPPVDLVVTTFPLGGHLLAAARRVGPLVPSVTYITDPAVHRLWLAGGTDHYLTTWSETAAALPSLLSATSVTPVTSATSLMSAASVTSVTTVTTVTTGASTDPGNALVHSVFPAVRPEFRTSAPGADGRTRRLLGLPRNRLALLSSGSWGVGAVLRSATEMVRHTNLTPVVVCGRNERLRRQVSRVPGAVALGWVDDMAGLMQVCDVAVLNSGGLTMAEAAVAGLPVVHYRPLPGQGLANARFGESTGWAPHCQDPERLAASIEIARTSPQPALPTDDPAAVLLRLLPPVRQRFPLAS